MTFPRRLAVGLAMLAVSAGVAAADPAPPDRPVRNRQLARWLSIGGVIGSAALAGTGALMVEYSLTGGRGYNPAYRPLERHGEILIGIGAGTTVFTPELGEWYAGDFITTGVELKAVGMGFGLISLAVYFGSKSACGDLFCMGPMRPDVTATAAVAAIGAAFFVAGSIYDLVDAAAAADRFNARFAVTPTVIPTPNGMAAGIGLSGRF
jgi:hypothetical protein